MDTQTNVAVAVVQKGSMQQTGACYSSVICVAYRCRQRQTWRVKAKPGSKIQPRNRRARDTVFSPPFPELLPPEQRPKEEVVGIKELVEDMDVGVDTSRDLTLLKEPLPGSFRCFSFHEDVDVYVAQNETGQLNLAHTYLYDRVALLYAIPHCGDDVPDVFEHYQVLPWDTWVSGDAENDEEEELQLHKVFFVRQTPAQAGQSSPRMHFEEVYCIDGVNKCVEKPEVKDLRDEKTVDPVLSIRDGEIVIQDTRDCPTMEGYAQIYGVLEYLDQQLAAREEMAEVDEELLDEREERGEPIDEQPDVPEADLL